MLLAAHGPSPRPTSRAFGRAHADTTSRWLACPLYLLALGLLPGRTAAGVAVGLATLSGRSLLWYQALPALLLQLIGARASGEGSRSPSLAAAAGAARQNV